MKQPSAPGPVGANDVRTLTETTRWDDMKVVIYHLTFRARARAPAVADGLASPLGF